MEIKIVLGRNCTFLVSVFKILSFLENAMQNQNGGMTRIPERLVELLFLSKRVLTVMFFLAADME